MVDASLIPTTVWRLVFEFLPDNCYNPIVFTRLSEICRSACIVFRSDNVWRNVNPYGLENGIYNHFSIAMSVLNPKQKREMRYIWESWMVYSALEQSSPYPDTPLYQLYKKNIPDIIAGENNYYNLGLILCTAEFIMQDGVSQYPITDKQLLLSAIKLLPRVYMRVDTPELAKDDDLVTALLTGYGEIIWKVPKGYKFTKEQLILAIKSCDASGIIPDYLGDWLNDKDVAGALVRVWDEYIKNVPKQVLTDVEFLKKYVVDQGELYFHAPKSLQNNREFLEDAVVGSDRVINDTMDLELWRLAVWAHPKLDVSRAPSEFKKELERMREDKVEGLSERLDALYTVRSKGRWNVDLPQKWANDREIVLAAVSKNGSRLRMASEAMKDDTEVVITALKTGFSALKYASTRLRADPHVVGIALKYDGDNLEYCDRKFRADLESVSLALYSRGEAILFASDNLKCDPDLLLRARCSVAYIHEEDLYEEGFYSQFSGVDPYLDIVNQMNMRMGIPPLEQDIDSTVLKHFKLQI